MGRLFGTAGIRGPYLDKVSPELAFKVGLAVATYLEGKGSVAIGHDVRTTSWLLASSVASGVMAGGLDAVSIGLAPTPVLAYSVKRLRARSGVVVTASHNPPEDNGLKCFNRDGMEYTEEMEEELERIIFEGRFNYAPWDRVGRLIQAPELIEDYVKDLIDRFKPERVKRRVRVIVDLANGAAYNITPRILRAIGAGVVTVNGNPDGFFPGRHPEPRPDVLDELGRITRSLRADGAFAHDGDADRLSVLDEGGAFIYNDVLIAFYAKLKLIEKGGGVVVVSIDTSTAVDEVVERYGGEIVRTKLGKTHEKLKELGRKAVMAAEPWKLIDPDWGPWVDGIYQATLITKKMLESGMTVSELLSDIPRYPQKRISYRVEESKKSLLYEEICNLMLESFRDYEELITIDGLRINMPDKSWVLVRKSGTEPKIRFYIEARSKKQLEEYISKVEKIMAKVLRGE